MSTKPTLYAGTTSMAASSSRLKKIKFQSLIIFAALAGMFPWVSFNLNSMDTQPWFLIIATAYIFTARKNIKNQHGELLIFIACALIFLVVSHEGDLFHTIRGMATYVAAVFAIIIFSIYVNIDLEKRLKVLIFVNWCWLLYPILQVLDVSSALPLVSSRTTANRGFTSLAPEPTFYGIFSLSMIAILYLEQEQWKIQQKDISKKNPAFFKWFIGLNIAQIFLIAQSSMAILLLLLLLIIGLFTYNTKIAATIGLATLIGGGAISLINSEFLRSMESRPLQVLGLFLEEPSAILIVDRSINERFTSIYVSTRKSFEDWLLPHGLTEYDHAAYEYEKTVEFIEVMPDNQGNKILSFIGSFLFELGFISFFYFYTIYNAISKFQNWRTRIFWTGSIFIVLLTAIPIGFPLVGYVIALINLNNRNNGQSHTKALAPHKTRLA